MLAGGDQPVRAGQGEVVLGAVPGISEEQLDEVVPPLRGPASLRGLVRGDQRGGVQRGGEHRPEPGGVGGVLGELGGDDEPVGGGDVLGVVTLQEPASADRHQPRIRVGDVADRARALFRGCPGLLLCGPGLGPFQRGAGPADGGRLPCRDRAACPRNPRCPAALACASWASRAAIRSSWAARARSSRCRAAATRGGRRRPGLRLPGGGRVQVGPGLRIAGGLRGLTFGFQLRQRPADPLVPAAAASTAWRQPVPAAALPEPLILRRVGGRVLREPAPRPASAAAPPSGSPPSTHPRRSSCHPAPPCPPGPCPAARTTSAPA